MAGRGGPLALWSWASGPPSVQKKPAVYKPPNPSDSVRAPHTKTSAQKGTVREETRFKLPSLRNLVAESKEAGVPSRLGLVPWASGGLDPHIPSQGWQQNSPEGLAGC